MPKKFNTIHLNSALIMCSGQMKATVLLDLSAVRMGAFDVTLNGYHSKILSLSKVNVKNRTVTLTGSRPLLTEQFLKKRSSLDLCQQ